MLKLPVQFSNTGKSFRDGSDRMCLICGLNGDHSTSILNPNILGSASGMPLSLILRRVVGEELLYPLSKFICRQCFLLLDRLDAYEAKATEIRSHIKEQYKETKFQFTSSGEKQITKLLESSLSDIKKYENGTTLDISDELSVTVFHEGRPRSSSNKGNLKREKVLLKHSIGCKDVKRRLNSLSNACRKKQNASTSFSSPSHRLNLSDDNNNTNNNNDDSNGKRASYTNCLDTFPPSLAESLGNDQLSSTFLEDDRTSTQPISTELLKVNESSIRFVDEIDDKSVCSSDADVDESAFKGNEDECSSDAMDGLAAASTLDEEALGKEEDLCAKPKSKNRSYDEANGEYQNPMVAPPGMAEAVLLQNSLASNILQSFLSSSLWMNSPDHNEQPKDSKVDAGLSRKDYPVVTADSLCESIGFAKDKKTRLELKNAGRSYVNTKGVLVDPKGIWPQDCSRCPLKCNQRIDDEMRVSVFTAFWGLGDYVLQRKYLSSHMDREERVAPSGKRVVIVYYLTHDGSKIQVCRQFFLKTLDISEKASRIVLKKKLKGEL